MDKNLRSYLTEMVGTFILVFLGAGAVCVNQVAIQSGQSGPGLVGIALAGGLALAAGLGVVGASAPPSKEATSGYLNPAVTITLWVFKRLDGTKAVMLVFMQLLGAAMAGGLLRTILMGQYIAMQTCRLGTPHVNLKAWDVTGVGLAPMLSSIVTEACLTFLVVIVIFGTLLDPRAPRLLGTVGRWLSPLWVGMVMAACILAGYSLTGAAANPARWFGTVIWEFTVSPLQTQRPMADHMVYWVGPILGALLAGGFYTALILPQEEESASASASSAASGKNPAGSTLFRARR